MSAPVAALKAVSHRESLAKTVRLLTRSGLDVRFRGHQPHVVTKGNKAISLVLPELNDTASPELIDAIQGYLDHEVGHIFYTPFARATKAGTVDPKAPALINIVEDIRLEKLLPRDLPGTRENLERMYEKFIPNMLQPVIEAAVATGDPSKAFGGVMVCAMRGLAGQKAFKQHMDDNDLWRHFMPLLSKMPNLARRLKEMESFADVEDIVTDILSAINPPKPPPGDDDDEGDDSPSSQPQPQPGDSDDESDGEEGGESVDDDSSTEDENDSAGSDADEGDEGDAPGDDEGNSESDDEGDDSPSSQPQPQPGDSDDESDGEEGGKGQSTKPGSITEAMKKLDPTRRKAFMLYKKDKKTVAEIAGVMNKSEGEIGDLLRSARKELTSILKGGRA